MAYYKFDEDDLFLNTVETYPQNKFYIQSGTVYINNFPNLAGQNISNHIGVPAGFISLYEYNIDRLNPPTRRIRPYVIKDGYRVGFKVNSSSSFAALPFGTVILSTYQMSASINRLRLNQNFNSASIKALENTFNHYSYLSPHYQYSSSLGDKSTTAANLITIPSIFYGSNIKKGTVNLKYYITGTLIGELSDFRENGDLVQIGPPGSTGSGSVAGSVLYNEGFIYLTGSWSLDNHSIIYDKPAGVNSSWLYYGFGTHSASAIALSTLSASYSLEFSGSSQFQTMTMLAHARYGELNHSTNPTYVAPTNTFSVSTGSQQYIEQDKVITNIVSSSFTDQAPRFEKTTYLSKVAIYDEDKNLIGFAKMATPVRKTETDQYTFKLKLDI